MNSSSINRVYNLEERLIAFAILCMTITENMISSRAASYFSQQLLRSASSPALNYGEAQSAESRKDFIHKMKIILKELRESLISLKIIARKPLTRKPDLVQSGLIECNELISIFVKSISTAEENGE